MYRSTISQNQEQNTTQMAVVMLRICLTGMLLVGLFVLFSGCEPLSSSEKDSSLEPGTFALQTEGYVDQTWEGNAVFENRNGKYFFLELRHPEHFENPEEHPDILLFEGGNTRPDPGTYSLPGNEFHSAYYSTVRITFEATGGTLTLTESNEEVIKGSFEFTATDDDKEVTITGTLHAEKGGVLNVDVF